MAEKTKSLIIVTPYRLLTSGEIEKIVDYLCLDIKGIYKEIIIIARLRLDNKNKKHSLIKIGNENIYIYPLTYYNGLRGILLNLPNILFDCIRILISYYSDIYLFRGVDLVSILIGFCFILGRKDYGIQVIGDPKSVYKGLTSCKLANNILAALICLFQRVLVRHSKCVHYVTNDYLQKIYKPGKKSIIYSFTNLYLPSSLYAKKERIYQIKKESWSFVFVGSLEQRYKGLHILMEALTKIKMNNYKLDVVGDGKYKNEYLDLAVKLGIKENIVFHGYVHDFNRLLKILDSSDIFILPSLTEGLPRAMIEAMARALPCIGTNVGGIPELLNKEDMVKPGDVTSLANKIIECTKDNERLNLMSKRNLARSMQYRYENIKEKRIEYFRTLSNL